MFTLKSDENIRYQLNFSNVVLFLLFSLNEKKMIPKRLVNYKNTETIAQVGDGQSKNLPRCPSKICSFSVFLYSSRLYIQLQYLNYCVL